MELMSALNDEPADKDKLNRDKYAVALARLAETCETPLVVGLYGTWGTGKTSLMKLIEAKLDREKVLPIWFDPWQHQFDESPILALAHTLTSTAGLGSQAEKILTVVASAFGSLILKTTTSLSLKDIDELGERLERERFMVREAQVRLREHFHSIVDKARGNSKRRIVFFIDDLDRCVPPQIMKMLESLKLYLNVAGCIYFLGVDRTALECSIKLQYKDIDLSERSYLDKIVQLPFTIPPILYDSIGEFIQHILPPSLKNCRDLLATGLRENPREIKRFVNSLILNHNLALSAAIPNYNPQILASLLMLQYCDSSLYDRIAAKPQIFFSLTQKTTPQEGLIGLTNSRLADALSQVAIETNQDLRPYIYLTQLVNIPQEGQPTRTIDLGGTSASHLRWLESEGSEGKLADLTGCDLSHSNLGGLNLSKARLRGAILNGVNLQGTTLIEADLRQAKLKGANLTRADLSQANLAEADLSNVDLRTTKLKGANLNAANLSGATLGADIVDANLSGLDLSGLDLTGINLKGVKLCGTNLSGTRLCEANLSGADLTGANFKGANLSTANLCGVTLGADAVETIRSANLHGADFSELDLSHLDLTGINFKNAKLCRSNFSGTRLCQADLSGADLTGANLKGADLNAANLSGARLGSDIIEVETIRSVSLHGADLSGLDLSHLNLTGINLTDAKLCRSNLSGTRLCEANLSGADLTGANLLSADLRGTIADRAVFVDCQLSQACFEFAILRKANFTAVRLSGCDLRNADLRRANMEQSNLAGADLSGADLAGASLNECILAMSDLSGTLLLNCDLRKTIGLESSQVQHAVTDESTLLPSLLTGE